MHKIKNLRVVQVLSGFFLQWLLGLWFDDVLYIDLFNLFKLFDISLCLGLFSHDLHVVLSVCVLNGLTILQIWIHGVVDGWKSTNILYCFFVRLDLPEDSQMPIIQIEIVFQWLILNIIFVLRGLLFFLHQIITDGTLILCHLVVDCHHLFLFLKTASAHIACPHCYIIPDGLCLEFKYTFDDLCFNVNQHYYVIAQYDW